MSRPTDAISAAVRDILDKPPSPGLFDESLAVVRAIEDRLAKSKTRPRILYPLNRVLIVPTALMFRGLGQLFAHFGKAYLAIALAMSVGIWLAPLMTPAIQQLLERVSMAGTVAAILLFVFAAPSAYCSTGVTPNHVTAVKDKLAGLSKERVDLLSKNFRVFEERVRRRLLMFKWVLGIGWAISFAPLLPKIAEPTVYPLSSFSLGAMAALLLTFVAIEAYSRGVDIVFRSLELGCNEHLAAIRGLQDSK